MNSTDLIFEEVDRINAEPAQGEQSIMVQHDMKKWAVENDMWPSSHYANIIDGHGNYRIGRLLSSTSDESEGQGQIRMC
jgi:hypothetical protein